MSGRDRDSLLLPLEIGKIGLDRIVLVEFGLDVIVDGGKLFLQDVDQFANRSFSAVPDLVPREIAQVLVGRL